MPWGMVLTPKKINWTRQWKNSMQRPSLLVTNVLGLSFCPGKYDKCNAVWKHQSHSNGKSSMPSLPAGGLRVPPPRPPVTIPLALTCGSALLCWMHNPKGLQPPLQLLSLRHQLSHQGPSVPPPPCWLNGREPCGTGGTGGREHRVAPDVCVTTSGTVGRGQMGWGRAAARPDISLQHPLQRPPLSLYSLCLELGPRPLSPFT